MRRYPAALLLAVVLFGLAASGAALAVKPKHKPVYHKAVYHKYWKKPKSKHALVAHHKLPPHPPAPKVVQLGASFTSNDLKRIVVGNQAGILKIYNADHSSVVFIKDAKGIDMVGIDGVLWAPLTDAHRTAIFGALNIADSEMVAVSHALIKNFNEIPKLQALAMLGVIGSIPDEKVLPDDASEHIRQFLAGLLTSQKNVVLRRQAVLSLALCDETDEATVQSVIAFMTQSHNAWETFTTRQFFQYHKDYIRSLPGSAGLVQEVQASGNPYASDIAALFN